MISNTRASRAASRYSSPARPPGGTWNGALETKSSGGQGSRAFMARWLEPSVQSKTSFEEAGLMRYGVLENMAPLGTMPKHKKAAPADGALATVRKIILRPSGGNAAKTANSPPNEPLPPKTPRASPRPSSSVSASPTRRKSLPAMDDGAMDEEGKTQTSGRRPRRVRRVMLTTNKTRRPSAADQGESVILAKTPTPSLPTPRKRRPPLEPEERAFADRVVEAAVDEALQHYRYPTAWAIRTLYDEQCDDDDFVAMVEAVFRQTADAETQERFARLLKEKKREGRKDNQGCDYFEPPTTGSRVKPFKAKFAPYAALLVGDGEAKLRAAKRPKSSLVTPHKTGSSVTVRTPRSNKQQARRGSGSSMSSLSSAMSLTSPEASAGSLSPSLRGATGAGAGVGTGAGDRTGAASRSGAGAGAGAAAGARPADAPKSQPITHTTRSKTAPSTSESSSTSRTHHRTRAQHAAAADDGLGSAADVPSISPVQRPSAPMPAADALWERRRAARRNTNAYDAQESSLRVVAAADDEESVATPARTARRTRQSLATAAVPVATRATRLAASKRPAAAAAADGDRNASPAAFSWQGDSSPAAASRAVTPPMLPPVKRQRTGLRVKTSSVPPPCRPSTAMPALLLTGRRPVKKKGSTAAGVPRSLSEPNSTPNHGAAKDPTSDNDEYCSACGNAGDVVCCDGCPRSFHFECVDMVQSDDLPDEWYCNVCLVRRFPSRVPTHKGIFASALNSLEKSNPRAFSLPKKVQCRFEGVVAGPAGDYEDLAPVKTVKSASWRFTFCPPADALCRKRNGYDELPDLYRQREDGKSVLCHACQTPAAEIKAIIPCSACPLFWHIDCLDPPLAVPPVLKTWRCPAHVDDVLTDVPRLAPAHRFRKVKGGHTIIPAVSRGLSNNGYVEIDWADERDEENRSGWPDPQSFGHAYKLTSSGVILDFIEQLRRQGAGYGSRQREPKRVPYLVPPAQRDPSTPLTGSALERQVAEMQLSLNLVGLRQQPAEPIGQLTSALLVRCWLNAPPSLPVSAGSLTRLRQAAADDNVLALMAKGNADNMALGRLTRDDRQSLRAMLAQMEAISARIRQALSKYQTASEVPAVMADARTPVLELAGLDETAAKIRSESTAPVAEPTPPSTVDNAEGSIELD